ncbi:Aspartate aminotransferase [Klebsiella variicola]|uniref:Aspartate aminotransferase n=1 Tax=Klebsiella variicola TaxID=244366 RepID=A0A7H4MHV8_KLEVA|nr:Aspartate aminotransferase [Klebsiella variicola]
MLPPAHISYAGIEAIVHHQTKYTAVSGTAALKEAIAAKFARDNQLHYRPQEIIAGSGAKQLIFNAFLATLDAGQQVIIPAPYWVSYPDMVSLADGEPVIVPCDEQNGWKLTPEQLAAALTPSTRWLILNSPGNPTGGDLQRAGTACPGCGAGGLPTGAGDGRRYLRAAAL